MVFAKLLCQLETIIIKLLTVLNYDSLSLNYYDSTITTLLTLLNYHSLLTLLNYHSLLSTMFMFLPSPKGCNVNSSKAATLQALCFLQQLRHLARRSGGDPCCWSCGGGWGTLTRDHKGVSQASHREPQERVGLLTLNGKYWIITGGTPKWLEKHP